MRGRGEGEEEGKEEREEEEERGIRRLGRGRGEKEEGDRWWEVEEIERHCSEIKQERDNGHSVGEGMKEVEIPTCRSGEISSSCPPLKCLW